MFENEDPDERSLFAQDESLSCISADGNEAGCSDEGGGSKGRAGLGCRVPLYTYVPASRLIFHA